jgi:ABC-type polysaccharide/polyol phosphate export permease
MKILMFIIAALMAILYAVAVSQGRSLICVIGAKDYKTLLSLLLFLLFFSLAIGIIS